MGWGWVGGWVGGGGGGIGVLMDHVCQKCSFFSDESRIKCDL